MESVEDFGDLPPRLRIRKPFNSEGLRLLGGSNFVGILPELDQQVLQCRSESHIDEGGFTSTQTYRLPNHSTDIGDIHLLDKAMRADRLLKRLNKTIVVVCRLGDGQGWARNQRRCAACRCLRHLAFSFGFRRAEDAGPVGFHVGVIEIIHRPMTRLSQPMESRSHPFQLFFAGRRSGFNAVLDRNIKRLRRLAQAAIKQNADRGQASRIAPGVFDDPDEFGDCRGSMPPCLRRQRRLAAAQTFIALVARVLELCFMIRSKVNNREVGFEASSRA